MSLKENRQSKIIEIIREQAVDTQEGLLTRLEEAGYRVTQATVSRDIRELKLTKVPTSEGHYRYATQTQENAKPGAKYQSILRETLIHVDFAGNFVALRTYSGMANAAAAAVDDLKLQEIVGTIAGDDTVFLLMRTQEDAREFCRRLLAMTQRN